MADMASWVTDDPKTQNLIVTALLLSGVLFVLFVSKRIAASIEIEGPSEKEKEKQKEKQKVTFPPIEPLPDFRWEEAEPLQQRPFKPHYHLTMGMLRLTMNSDPAAAAPSLTNAAIENISANDLLLFDNTYKDRLELRRKIISEHYPIVIGAADSSQNPKRRQLATAAVHELYTWLMSTYLPTRYPRIFRIVGSGEKPKELLNTATGAYIPCQPPAGAPVEKTLETMGLNIDEEFLFLLPSADGDGYALEAFVTCAPNGFDTSKKRGLKLRDIHKPVPGYKEKLEKSMDRFFDKLEVGRYVRRVNWAITTDGELFAGHGGHHMYEGDEFVEEDVDIDQTYLRSERQTLQKLPQTGAIVFAFHTYLYPIRQIKEEEGGGEELAQAIDGLKTGNVPAISWYKKAVVWAPQVTAYLRS